MDDGDASVGDRMLQFFVDEKKAEESGDEVRRGIQKTFTIQHGIFLLGGIGIGAHAFSVFFAVSAVTATGV